MARPRLRTPPHAPSASMDRASHARRWLSHPASRPIKTSVHRDRGGNSTPVPHFRRYYITRITIEKTTVSAPEVMKVIHSATGETQCAICPADYLACITSRSGCQYHPWSWQRVTQCEPALSYLVCRTPKVWRPLMSGGLAQIIFAPMFPKTRPAPEIQVGVDGEFKPSSSELASEQIEYYRISAAEAFRTAKAASNGTCFPPGSG